MNTTMNSITRIIIAATLSVLSGYAQAGETVKRPCKAVSFHTGSKHAVGYFLKDDGACQLVVTAADDANYAPTRFETAIADGASTTYEFAGKSLEFGCRDHAQLMAINTFEAVATNR
jgi:hypothetical protein